MRKYAVYVYVDGWHQRPFSRCVEAKDKAEAIEKVARGLKADEHLMDTIYGDPWVVEVED